MTNEEEDVVSRENPYWTVAEVAATFKVSQATVRDWINQEKLKAITLDNGQYRILQSVVQQFAKRRFL